MIWPRLALPGTDGAVHDLSALPGRAVVCIYSMTARPDVAAPEGWEMIPGARGCTPHSCAFRDLMAERRAAGVNHVFGLSVQDTAWQQEVAARLHPPFALLSDAELRLARALERPVMTVAGRAFLKRMVLVLDAGRIAQVFYPVFPLDRSADLVLDRLRPDG